jgi:tetratricopeptide (TPR) repeat protein
MSTRADSNHRAVAPAPPSPSHGLGRHPPSPDRPSGRFGLRPEFARKPLFVDRQSYRSAPRILGLFFVAGSLAACFGAGEGPELSHQGSARFLVAAGDTALEEGRLDDARRRYEEALSLARGTSEKAEEVLALNQLGVLDERLGALEDATNHYQRALNLQQAADAGPGEALIRTNLAGVLSARGRQEEAEEEIARAIELSRPVDDPANAGATRLRRAQILERAGRHEEAAADLEQAAVLFSRGGRAREEASVRLELGRVLLECGDVRHAVMELSRSQEGLRRVPVPKQDLANRLRALRLLAQAYDQLAQPKNAFTFRERAVELARTAADPPTRRAILEEAIAAADRLGKSDVAAAWRKEVETLD